MTIEHKKFPSINQFRHAVKSACYGQKTPTLKFRGTVKLHGTNCAIVFHDGGVGFQSKNRMLTVDDDHFDFAATMEPLIKLDGTDRLAHLVSLVNERGYHFDTAVEPVYIYGEWCGGSIKKKVAISKLDRMFVIFRIQIGDRVLDQEEMKHVSLPQHRIFNIMDFPSFQVTVDMTKPQVAQNTFTEITEDVEQLCPVGNALGVDGVGEGVVWQCVTDGYRHINFKVKGEKHSKTKVKTLAPVDVEKVNNLNEFLDNVVQEWRLQQGVEYLREIGKPIEEKSTGDFIRWVFNDIVKEESDTMEESGIKPKEIGKPLSQRVRNWWFDMLDRDAMGETTGDQYEETEQEQKEEAKEPA